MKTVSHIKPYQKALIALTVIILLVLASSTPSTYASPNATETDPRRLNMLGIDAVRWLARLPLHHFVKFFDLIGKNLQFRIPPEIPPLTHLVA